MRRSRAQLRARPAGDPKARTARRSILQKRRQERGAIDFDLPEPMLTYDEEGDVTGIVKSVRHFSHRIVEEFMILANEVVARHLEEPRDSRRSIAFTKSPIRRKWRISRRSWPASD